MKAVSYTKHGAPSEVLEYGDLSDPVAGDGEVLIKIHTSGVNPSDVKARAGVAWAMTAPRTIAHSDGAGVIEAVGAGVDPARVGQRVGTYNVNRSEDGIDQGANGTAAEYTAVNAALAVPLPDSVGFIEAAALGVPAMTSYAALLTDGPVAGMTVLVTGGAGAVGSLAIQIAKWSGAARIVATVSSDAKAQSAIEDGADATVNYRDFSSPEDLATALLAANGGERFHRIVDVDFGAHIAMASTILQPGGVIGTYASIGRPRIEFDFYPLMMNGATLRLIEIYAQSPERFIEIQNGVNRLLEASALKPRIDSTYPLRETAAAHDRVESGRHAGNVIVEV